MSLEVLQTRWNDDWDLACVNYGAEGHQCDTSFERQEIGSIMWTAFREHGNTSTVAENVLYIFEYCGLVNFWETLVGIRLIWIIYLRTRLFQQNLSVAHNFFYDLIFNLQLIRGAENLHRVAHGKILDKFTILVSDHGQIVLEGNFSFACFGKILSPLNGNRFTPSKEMAQDWSPSTFTGDHESYVSLSREKEDAAVDELIAVVSAEDQGTTLWNVVLT